MGYETVGFLLFLSFILGLLLVLAEFDRDN